MTSSHSSPGHRLGLCLMALFVAFCVVDCAAQKVCAGNAVTGADGCSKSTSTGNSRPASSPPPPPPTTPAPRPNPYAAAEKAAQQRTQQTNQVINNTANSVVDAIRRNRSDSAGSSQGEAVNPGGYPADTNGYVPSPNVSYPQQQQPNNAVPSVSREANSVVTTPNSGYTAPPSVASAIGTLLDTGSPPSDAATIESILDDPVPDSNSRGTAGQIADLLGNGKGASGVTSSGMNQLQPTITSIASLNALEQKMAQAIGSDWAMGLKSLTDAALKQIAGVVPSPADAIAGVLDLDQDDYLKKGAEETMKSFLPETSEAESTLGSVIQDKAVSYAGDKMADTLTEAKDELACSNANSEVEHDGCMVLIAPSNLGRGLYNYGVLLVDRFGKMMDSVNADFKSQQQ